jgi:hypothetical protein
MASSFMASTKARMRLPLPKKLVKTASKRKSSASGVMEWQSTKRQRTIKNPNEKQSVSKNKTRSSKPTPKTDIIVLLDESDDNTHVGDKRKVNISRNPTETHVGRETIEDAGDESEFEFEG